MLWVYASFIARLSKLNDYYNWPIFLFVAVCGEIFYQRHILSHYFACQIGWLQTKVIISRCRSLDAQSIYSNSRQLSQCHASRWQQSIQPRFTDSCQDTRTIIESMRDLDISHQFYQIRNIYIFQWCCVICRQVLPLLCQHHQVRFWWTTPNSGTWRFSSQTVSVWLLLLTDDIVSTFIHLLLYRCNSSKPSVSFIFTNDRHVHVCMYLYM